MCTPGTWSTRCGQRYTPFDAKPVSHQQPLVSRLRRGRRRSARVRARRLHCSPTRRARRSARNSANMKLMLNDYNTELPGKRASVMQIVRDAGQRQAMPSTVSATSSTCSSTPNVAQVTAAFGARSKALSSTLVNHVTELDVSIYARSGQTASRQRTIPPCVADYGAKPAAERAFPAGTAVSRSCSPPSTGPSVTSVSLLGHRGQSHLAQHLPGDPHQPSAVVRHRRRSEVGVLGGGRSVVRRSLEDQHE